MKRLSHTSVSSSPPLARSFYERQTVDVAKDLLGKILVGSFRFTALKGIIVETEAYGGEDDPASHAYRGPTRRNQVMYGPPGHAYVYFTYGMHYCLNVKTEPSGQPGAVLIRALQPRSGIERMKKIRGTERIEDLTNGPARLTQTFGVTNRLNGHDLTTGRRLFIVEDADPGKFEIASSSRIGISVATDRLWRFFISGSRFVSKQRPTQSLGLTGF